MRKMIVGAMSALAMLSAGAAFAGDEYNTVPAGDAQYAACLKHAMTDYTGGGDRSNIAGQTNAEAWCTCLWNETPDNFRGSLVKFSESPAGKRTNKLCEKYAGWGS